MKIKTELEQLHIENKRLRPELVSKELWDDSRDNSQTWKKDNSWTCIKRLVYYLITEKVKFGEWSFLEWKELTKHLNHTEWVQRLRPELDLVELKLESKELWDDGGEGWEDDHLGDVQDQRIGRNTRDLEWALQLLETENRRCLRNKKDRKCKYQQF